MNRIKIGERWLGEGEPVYIVAEAGSNHNGSLEQAFRLVDVATRAGADAVKFQNFKAATLYPRAAGQSDYLKNPRSIYDIIEDMEMPEEWVPRLAAYCRDEGIEFLSSPFDEGMADLIEPWVNAFKIASYEITHLPLVRHVARFGKPVILSTGASDLDDVERTVEAITREGNDQIILLQCTASYPTPPDDVNVRAISALREATKRPVGLSDHSRHPVLAPVLATALGACLIEKHFTLSNQLPGPDHRFAVEPDELAQLVDAVRVAGQMLGHGRKEVLAQEAELHAFARRSIFATRPICAGEILSRENLAVLRCGKLAHGLEPALYENLLGRVAARNIPPETAVTLADLG